MSLRVLSLVNDEKFNSLPSARTEFNLDSKKSNVINVSGRAWVYSLVSRDISKLVASFAAAS